MSGTNQDKALKSSLTVALMVPVAVALVAGAYFSLSDLGQGLPMLAGGVVLLVFNIFVIRYMFAKLASAQQDGQTDAQSEPQAPDEEGTQEKV